MHTKVVNKTWHFLLDTLFPKRCVACRKFGGFLCAECAGKVERLSTSICYECGRITRHSSYCSVCKNRKLLKLNGVIVSAKYESPVKELVAGLKYGGYIEISELLGELIVQRLLNSDIKFEKAVLVPVPLHRSRKLVRGFNQSELIARYISKKLNLPGGDALKKIRKTLPQVGLTRDRRLFNIQGVFTCTDPELVAGKNVFLVDDVATTGATLNECAKVLKASGARSVTGVVVGRHIN